MQSRGFVMRVLELKLVGYKPLLQRGINEFHWTITSPWQIIIGANGSGKTSIMRQTSPLPAAKDDFIAGKGSKEIWLEHNGHKYYAVSSFKHGNQHELYDLADNVNLNPGRTLTVQKQLVKKIFGLDHELFEVLLGERRFTHMSTIERRDWLLNLSQMDMDFAMRVFGNLKQRLRDSQGVVKHLAKRLADEIERLPNENELIGLDSKVRDVTENLNALMIERLPNTKSSAAIKTLLESIKGTSKTIGDRILRNPLPMPATLGFHSNEDIETKLQAMSVTLGGINERLRLLYSEHEEYREILDTMEKANIEGFDELEARIVEQESFANATLTKCRRFKLTENVDRIELLSNAALPLVEELLTDIPVNYERKFNKFTLAELRDELIKSGNTCTRLTNTIDGLSHKLTHSNDEQLIDCPACKYKWRLGYSEHEVTAMDAKLDELLLESKAAMAVYNELKTLEEEQTGYYNVLRKLKHTFGLYPEMQLLWDALLEDWNSGQYPRLVLGIVITWKEDLALSLSVFNALTKVKEHKKYLDDAKNLKAGSKSLFAEKADSIQHAINSTLEEKIELSESIRVLSHYKKGLDTFFTNYNELNKQFELLNRGLHDYEVAVQQELLDGLIKENQQTLAMSTSLLQRATQAKLMIDDIVATKNKEAKNIEALTLLVQELSPVDGLIAEQLKLFIESFTGQLNNAVGYVWTYPLRVLSCGLDTSELDFKFPLKAHDSDLDVPDIKEGSTAQVDIINFAFRLVVMMYKGLSDFPLYLDELAPSLDERHRLNIIDFVKYLMDAGKASQLFMISHYAAQSTVFTRAEICVTDETNIITLPSVYNQHIKMA